MCVTLIVYELSPHDARRWPRASQVRHPLCILIHHSNPLVFLRRSRRARFATSNFGIWSPAVVRRKVTRIYVDSCESSACRSHLARVERPLFDDSFLRHEPWASH